VSYPKVSEEELAERQTAQGLLTGAKEFREASLVLVNHENRSEIGDYFENTSLINPYFFLVGQSVELSLKSILLHKGNNHRFLRNEIRHNLLAAAEAVKHHVPPTEVFFQLYESTLHLINELYNTKQLQYRLTGVRTVPTIKNADFLCRNAHQIARDTLAGRPLQFDR
jgi:hypothetical protein